MEYGLIGEKLSHSFSKIIHNMLGYDYELCELAPGEVGRFMAAKNFRAINVTIPYKQTVIPYLDRISEEAESIGSVNTIVRQPDGKLFGYNTDLCGFLYMVRRAGITLAGKKVLILGSGGTSLTALAACRHEKVREVVTVSRNGVVNYGNISDQTDTQIIINATPVGMYPKNGASLIDMDSFPQLEGVVDVIYNPLFTKLLLDAKQRSIPCTNGLSMLVAQAKYASELFFGKSIPDQIGEGILKKLTRDSLNIVLVGMPGCGKTTIAAELSKLSGRTVADTDAFIAEKAGMSIPDIFVEYGESVFRQTETEAVQEIGKLHGAIIATGGGSILKIENVEALRQNGFIVYIDRDISQLDGSGRPLSANSDAIKKLSAQRKPIYECIKDITIVNDSSPKNAALSIWEKFNGKAFTEV